jgi:hypothetical protein
MTDDRTRIETLRATLTDALIQAKITQQRTIGWHSAIINATRNADRIVLANDAETLRLQLSWIEENLRDALKMLMDLESEGN